MILAMVNRCSSSFFILLLFSLLVSELVGQSSHYEQLNSNLVRLTKENKKDSALRAAVQMKDWLFSNEGDTSLLFAISLREVGRCYEALNKADSAKAWYFNSIERCKNQHRIRHPEYATSLMNLGILFFKSGDLVSAEPYFKEAMEIRKVVLGENHVDFAASLNACGLLEKKKGNLGLAESYIRQASDVYKRSNGEEHPGYAGTLNNLGQLYKQMSDYKKAKDIYRKALDLRRKMFGEEHPDYAASMHNLGVLYADMGEYDTAEYYETSALKIKIKVLGEDHPDCAQNLNDIGVLYAYMGDARMAESFFKESLRIRERAFGEASLKCASNQNNLGSLYLEIGDFKSSEFHYKKALNIHRSSFTEEHPDIAVNLNNLGSLYFKMGDYKSADKYFHNALSIFQKLNGIELAELARCYYCLGILYMELGNFNVADSFFIKSQEIRSKTIGEKHPEFANGLRQRAQLFCRLNDLNQAELLFNQAIDIMGNAVNIAHQDYLSLRTELASLLLKKNREIQAFSIFTESFNFKTKQIVDNFEWLNDNQKEAYWKQEKDFYDEFSWFANQSYQKVPEMVGLNYNSALISKSKLLEGKISSENYYREVDEIREELAYRRRLIAKMESDGSVENEKLQTLRTEADSLDKRLSLSWPEYAEQKKNLSITWQQVQQHLDKNEASIEFVRFQNEEDSLYYYNALVLRNDSQQPTLVKLCKEKDLENFSPKMGFSAYYPLVWQPMEKLLKGITTVYYAPTGLLYNVPFSALYAPKGKGDQLVPAKTDKRGVVTESAKATTEEGAGYLMDRYSLHQLTSTRYLAMGIKQKAKNPISKDMTMVGDVNYDYLPGSNAVEVKDGKKDKNISRSSESASGKLARLEGTKLEVEQIQRTVAQNTWTTTVLSGNEAKEENVVKLEGKEARSILHLATHGYAFPEYDFNDTTVHKSSLRYSYRFSQNPMVRSGLILAGGNWAWMGSDTLAKLGAEQNGILTAAEVSQLNLKKTKLVVLSACETGLGTIEGSEGTFGLKRGFKLAGVEQMIVSLWSVPDRETMELMTLFYSDLTKSLNPITSFEKAQRDMRKKYPQEPNKWAGFILVR